MTRIYRDVISILLPRERWMFYALLAVAAASALFEAASVASILPLLSVLAQPELVEESAILARIYAFVGLDDIREFQMLLATGTFALLVVSLGLKMLTLYSITRYSAMRGYTLSSRLLQGYLHQPYEFFLDRHSSEIGRTVLYEVHQLIARVLQPFLLMAASSFVVLFIVVVLFLADPLTATLVASALSLAYGAIYFTIRNRLMRLGAERMKSNEGRFRMTLEPMEGIKYVKLRGLENTYVSRYRQQARIMAKADAMLQVLRTLPRHVLEITGFGGMLVFIMFSLVRHGAEIGQLIPTLGLIAFAGLRLLPALQMLFAMAASIKGGQAVAELVVRDIRDSTGAREAADRREDAISSLALKGKFEIANVSYTYPNGERPSISDLSIRIDAKSTVGIVGGTGAGKTTAIDLLLGLIIPQSDQILVDGVPIDQATRSRWQRSVGYVPQTIFLIAESITENIAFGVPPDEIDMERVITAAKMAALHDFVMSELPEGYDSLVGERGVRLSGGQRQRVGIARALYFDPQVLIFDEATSALDNITERTVMEAIERLGGQKTIVMIAHRLSTVKNCDRIFLLEQGTVTASGTFTELTEASDTFMEMVRHADG